MTTATDAIIATARRLGDLPIPEEAALDIDYRSGESTIYIHADGPSIEAGEIIELAGSIDNATIYSSSPSLTYLAGTIDGREATVFFDGEFAEDVSRDANILIEE
jgi:hypothetical protein